MEKTKVRLLGNPKQCVHEEGDEGYIDGYVRGGDDIPYAVVIVGVNIDLCPLHLLIVLCE